MKLIVGLGNPGKEYENTRHNIGFNIVDTFLNVKSEASNWKEKDGAEYIILGTTSKVIYIKPTTYMNLSGRAVRNFMNFYKIEVKDVLVIHDDLDLELGTYKLKKSSTSGGHNGVQSIIDELGTNDFLRLKIGISKPEYDNIIDFVLKKFAPSELEQIVNNTKVFHRIIKDFIASETAEKLMNKYN